MATTLTRKHKALTIVPLALICGAWTASLTGLGGAEAVTPVAKHTGRLPDGTRVPSQAITAPATVPSAGSLAPAVPSGTAGRAVVNSANTTGIPSPALSAYMRSAQIINGAAPTCHMPWQLVAAIGRVESDHGRYAGNTLSTKGISSPGIYGPVLDGSHGTQLIRDTDQGRLDHNTSYDRAVGAMQFIPSTWAVVGVDADKDGVRNPQDINDASLATAVYLCSGGSNLSSDSGRSQAVYRYNHSQQYVALVLSIMHAYMSGDYTSVPSIASGGTVFAPSSSAVMNQARKHAIAHQQHIKALHTPATGHGGGVTSGGGGTTSSAPSGPTTTAPNPVTPGGGSTPGGGLPTLPSLPKPPKLPKPTAVPSPVQQALTKAQATTKCLAQVGASSVATINPLKLTDFNSCMANLGF